MQDVVVTGSGVVSSLGSTVDAYWEGLKASRSGIRTATAEEFGSDAPGVWAPVLHDFVGPARLDPRVEAGSDRHTQMLMVAAGSAFEDSKLDSLDPLRTAVITGTSMGGLNSVIEGQEEYDAHGPSAIPNKVQIKMWPNMGAAQLAYKWKLHGPQLTVCTACASSADAIGIGARHIQSGLVDVALVGGSDAHLKPLVLLAAGGLGAGSSSMDPERALMPFDKDRTGMVVGEGAGVLVLERRQHAEARGARILGSVRGYASLADSYHPSSPDPTGEWQALTMKQALVDADLDVGDVAAVVAHGTGTRIGDVSEIRALNDYLGDRAPDVKVASIKGHIGHTSGAAAVMSAIAAIRGLDEGTLVHNRGTSNPEDEARFEVVTHGPAAITPGAIQINAFGFGGQNASLVFTRD